MTAAEDSVLGLALQSAVNTENETDAKFKYMLFREGTFGPQNIVLPIDPEVGGGALPRGMVKVATSAGGALDIIPRPSSLGLLLFGATGSCTTTTNYNLTGVHAAITCDGSEVTTGITDPATATKLYVTPSDAITGDIVIAGKDADGETIDGGETLTDLESATLTTNVFSEITGITVPDDGAKTVSVGWADGTYTHTFTLDSSDNYSAPYFTARQHLGLDSGTNYGEVFIDVRPAMLNLNWQAPGFIRGMVNFVGRSAEPSVDTEDWDTSDYTDGSPPLLTSPGDSVVIGSTTLDVLSGTIVMANGIPMDEQFKVGSYYPSGVDIVSRSYGIQLAVKLADEDLYDRMMYDKDAGGAWLANVYKNGSMTMNFKSGENAGTNPITGSTYNKYTFSIAGNGQTGADSNIEWMMEPLALRAQRNIVASISGIITADPSGSYDPVTITLINQDSGYSAT